MTHSGLESFGRGLGKEDEVVIEATGNAMAVVRTLSPYSSQILLAASTVSIRTPDSYWLYRFGLRLTRLANSL